MQMILAMFWAAICEYFRGSRRPVRTIFMNLKNAAAFTHFSPCRWIPHSLGQVLASRALARAPKNPSLSRTRAGKFPDGTPCILDVAEPEPARKNAGTIFFCPGFSGSIESPYVQWFVHAALQRGYVVVVYNRRAHTPESRSPTYPLHYQPDDLDTAIAWTVAKYGARNLYGVGVSAGGNLLMRAQFNPSPFKAIVSVCNGFDIEKVCKNKNPLANAVICSFVREVLQNVAAPKIPLPPSRLNTMTDLEEWALAKFNGQNQPMSEYYRACSCAHVISDITTPTLCINSLDDTLIPHPVEYYTDLIQQNRNISIILTSHGGHVGYLDKAWRCDWWCENALDFIEAAAAEEEIADRGI